MHPATNLRVEGQEGPTTHMTTDATTSRTDLAVIAEAILVIDKALGEMGHRQLVSSSEIADVLLDVRQLLTESTAPVAH